MLRVQILGADIHISYDEQVGKCLKEVHGWPPRKIKCQFNLTWEIFMQETLWLFKRSLPWIFFFCFVIHCLLKQVLLLRPTVVLLQDPFQWVKLESPHFKNTLPHPTGVICILNFQRCLWCAFWHIKTHTCQMNHFYKIIYTPLYHWLVIISYMAFCTIHKCYWSWL